MRQSGTSTPHSEKAVRYLSYREGSKGPVLLIERRLSGTIVLFIEKRQSGTGTLHREEAVRDHYSS
jgi:hypothetical protein